MFSSPKRVVGRGGIWYRNGRGNPSAFSSLFTNEPVQSRWRVGPLARSRTGVPVLGIFLGLPSARGLTSTTPMAPLTLGQQSRAPLPALDTRYELIAELG